MLNEFKKPIKFPFGLEKKHSYNLYQNKKMSQYVTVYTLDRIPKQRVISMSENVKNVGGIQYDRYDEACFKVTRFFRNTMYIIAFRRTLIAAYRIQRCIRAYLLNKHLRTRLMVLHSAAASKLDILKKCLEFHPEDLHSRARWLALRTVFHSAIKGGNFQALVYLNPSHRDCVTTDSAGRNVLHYLSVYPSMAVAHRLAETLSGYDDSLLGFAGGRLLRGWGNNNGNFNDSSKHSSFDDASSYELPSASYGSTVAMPTNGVFTFDSSAAGGSHGIALSHLSMSPLGSSDSYEVDTNAVATAAKDLDDILINDKIKELIAESIAHRFLRAGWLLKKRNSMMFQRRWVVVTEDYLVYFKDPQSVDDPRFFLQLDNQTSRVVHAAGKEPVLEILTRANPTTSATLTSSKLARGNSFFRSPSWKATSSPRPTSAGSSNGGGVGFFASLLLGGGGTNNAADTVQSVPSQEYDVESSGNVKTTVFSLKAENEQELQQWFSVLRAYTKSTYIRHASTVGEGGDLLYINLHVRAMWVSAVDCNGDTPLHVLSRSLFVDTALEPEAVKFAAWLIESGCPVNARNKLGHTALHIAVSKKSAVLTSTSNVISAAFCLALLKKGADNSLIRNAAGQTVTDLLRANASAQNSAAVKAIALYILSLKRSGDVNVVLTGDDLSGRIPAGKLLPFSSYLTLFFGQFSLPTGCVYTMRNPYMRIHVLNACRQLMEDVAEIHSPVLVGSKSVYWGWTFHMQTPLENLEGCTILIQFSESPSEEGNPATSIPDFIPQSDEVGATSPPSASNNGGGGAAVWVRFPIVNHTINSGAANLLVNTSDKPAALQQSPSSSARSSGGKGTIAVDVCVHRKVPQIPLKMVLQK